MPQYQSSDWHNGYSNHQYWSSWHGYGHESRWRPNVYRDDYVPPAKRPKIEKSEVVVPVEQQIGVQEFAALRKLLFGEMLEQDDVERWEQQSFEFCESSGPAWGLKQKHGGPCGVLAAVQGFLLCEIFSELKNDVNGHDIEVRMPADDGHLKMAQGGAFVVLARALTAMLKNVLPEGASTFQLVKWGPQDGTRTDPASRIVHTVSLPDAHSALTWLVAEDGKQLRQPGAVLSFVASLLLTRGLATSQNDMDDPGQNMITTFGHCSQELMNLCLTGKGTSNVHDGNITLGDEGEDSIILKGVDQPPAVGYLSAFEALNQLQVGRCYKQPKWPIWVIGGPMHYTICFSPDCSLNHVELRSESKGSGDDGVKRSEVSAPGKCGVCGSCLSMNQPQNGCGTLCHFNGLEQKVVATGQTIRSPQMHACTLSAGQSDRTVASSDEDTELFQVLLRSRWQCVDVSFDGADGCAAPRLS